MLNYIWALMIVIGIIVAAFTGKMECVSTSILDSSKEAINLCIMMFGVVGMWTGVMKIAEETGLVKQLTRLAMPVLCILFPRVDDSETMGYIATNMIANILGLGWAATPSGIKAMKALRGLQMMEDKRKNVEREMCEEEKEEGAKKKREKDEGAKCERANGEEEKSERKIVEASDEMCMLILINISSLQLIPMNMIAYRSQYGSAHPGLIILPAIVATSISTLVAIAFGYCMCRIGRKQGERK